jgi:regulatory protein
VVGELASSGLADDRRFAEAFVRSRAGRGQGPVRIARELRGRGVADELVREALAPYAREWRERMEAVRSRRFGSETPGREERLRQARFLEQRGFPRDLIGAWLDQ